METGEIVAAIEHEVRRHGITEFEIVRARNEEFSSDAGVDVYDTWGISTRQFSEPPYVRPVFLAGAGRINELERLSRKNARRAEMNIVWGVAHEAGHVFRPKNPTTLVDGKTPPPWTADEVWDSRERRGMDNRSLEAVSQRESQANLYATVECLKDMKSTYELKEHIAAMCLEAITQDEDTIGQIPKNGRGAVIRYAARNTVACLLYWMKPHIVDEIAELAVKKYEAELGGRTMPQAAP